MSDLETIFDEVTRDKIRRIPDKPRVIATAREKGRLLAVRGNYDCVERVLPHCYAAVKELIDADRDPPDLASFDVVFVGCPGRLSADRWHKPLREFVEAGGVVLTTDWCLENLVAPLFPGTVRKRGTAEGTFPLRLRQPQHPLLEGLAGHEGTPRVVEAASSRIEVLDPARVAVAADAPGMGEPAAVVIAFPVGKGLVVHTLSHFHLQGSDKSGEYVSAYLLANVIDEAMHRRHPAVPRIRALERGKPPRIRVLPRGG